MAGTADSSNPINRLQDRARSSIVPAATMRAALGQTAQGGIGGVSYAVPHGQTDAALARLQQVSDQYYGPHGVLTAPPPTPAPEAAPVVAKEDVPPPTVDNAPPPAPPTDYSAHYNPIREAKLIGRGAWADIKGQRHALLNRVYNVLGERQAALDQAKYAQGDFREAGRNSEIGGGIGELSGPLAGAGVGAAAGSVVPVLGTAIGGVVGGLAGTFLPKYAEGASGVQAQNPQATGMQQAIGGLKEAVPATALQYLGGPLAARAARVAPLIGRFLGNGASNIVKRIDQGLYGGATQAGLTAGAEEAAHVADPQDQAAPAPGNALANFVFGAGLTGLHKPGSEQGDIVDRAVRTLKARSMPGTGSARERFRDAYQTANDPLSDPRERVSAQETVNALSHYFSPQEQTSLATGKETAASVLRRKSTEDARKAKLITDYQQAAQSLSSGADNAPQALKTMREIGPLLSDEEKAAAYGTKPLAESGNAAATSPDLIRRFNREFSIVTHPEATPQRKAQAVMRIDRILRDDRLLDQRMSPERSAAIADAYEGLRSNVNNPEMSSQSLDRLHALLSTPEGVETREIHAPATAPKPPVDPSLASIPDEELERKIVQTENESANAALSPAQRSALDRTAQALHAEHDRRMDQPTVQQTPLPPQPSAQAIPTASPRPEPVQAGPETQTPSQPEASEAEKKSTPEVAAEAGPNTLREVADADLADGAVRFEAEGTPESQAIAQQLRDEISRRAQEGRQAEPIEGDLRNVLRGTDTRQDVEDIARDYDLGPESLLAQHKPSHVPLNAFTDKAVRQIYHDAFERGDIDMRNNAVVSLSLRQHPLTQADMGDMLKTYQDMDAKTLRNMVEKARNAHPDATAIQQGWFARHAIAANLSEGRINAEGQPAGPPEESVVDC